MKTLKQKNWIFYLPSICFLAITYPATAQISSDGTIPTEVINSGDTIEIVGGSREGDNLFHSFAEFSVPNGRTAYFQNSSDISNIIGRVTGQSISNIDGILKTNGSANLFLINPNGIIFGANAQLDIGGSFIATTASSIKFADGTEFSATNKQASPLLTVSIPVGLQFGASVGSIINRSVASSNGETNFSGTSVGLQVASDKTLALIGGNIIFDGGNLTAMGGRVELGSVDSNSFVRLLPIEQGWKLSYEGVENFRDIQLSNRSIVDVSGLAGNISIYGQNIKLIGNSVFVNSTLADKDSGNSEITALNSLEIVSSYLFNQVGQNADIDLDVDVVADANGGNLNISTKQLIVQDGGGISSGTVSQGNAGNITINALDSVEITGNNRVIPSFLSTSTEGTGKGGELTINTKNLIVKDGASIEAATLGQGQGGSININASESVDLSGVGQLADGSILFSNLSASAGTREFAEQSIENGGNLNINTKQLTVRDGAEMTVSNFGTGNAGTLTIDADSVLLENDGILNAATRSGNGGNINFANVNTLVLQNRGQIITSAGDRGNGGNIFIDANTLTLLDNSTIAAGAFQGQGGVIQIETQGLFQSPDSRITAASEVGVNGIVQITRPRLDPAQALTELPETVVDVRGLIGDSCGDGKDFAENRFTIIGRGGLPLDPDRAIEVSTVQEDLGDSSDREGVGEAKSRGEWLFAPTKVKNNYQLTTQHSSVIEAQRWMKNTDGNIVLVGNNPIVSDRDLSSNGLACSIR
jgi:filamentous hemagglutinin family protein